MASIIKKKILVPLDEVKKKEIEEKKTNKQIEKKRDRTGIKITKHKTRIGPNGPLTIVDLQEQ